MRNQEGSKTVLSLEALRKNPSLPLAQLLVAPDIPWLVAASLPCLPVASHGLLAHVSVSSPLRIQTPVIGFRTHSKSRMLSSRDS